MIRCSALLVLLLASSAVAQEVPPSTTPEREPSPWAPLGLAPVDQAGAGRRGYVLAGEDSDVAAAGANRLSIHGVAANNFYREQNGGFLITQRYETHTIALGYRHGFELRGFPRFEIGGQVQLHESDGGMMNGFILGIESLWSSVTGYRESVNELRGTGAATPPLGTVITRNGVPLYREGGSGSGFGDSYATVKVALLDDGRAAWTPRVAARFGINVAGTSAFSEGNFVGAGVSLDQRLLAGVAFHGDLRATHALDAMSVWNLPLRRWSYGFSAGPEFKIARNTSLNLQIDGNTTPYLPTTGTLAFDAGYGDITVGVGHRFGSVLAQFYVRENMNLPFTVRWNTDPDMSMGLRIRVH